MSSLQDLIGAFVPSFMLGFAFGFVLWFIVWCICKLWSFIYTMG